MGQQAGSRREQVRAEAAAWVVRLSAPDCSEADRAAFEAWRDASFENEAAYEREAAAWERLDRLQALRPGNAAPDPDLLAPAPEQPAEAPTPTPRAWWAQHRRMAASLVGLVALGSAATLGIASGDPAYATGIGETRVLVLEDGTRVELNTDSKIRVRFRDDRREVVLERGEALFHVSKAAKPFVVRTEKASFRTAGSELAVRLNDKAATVTVSKGSVLALPAEAEEGVAAPSRLAAGLSGTFHETGGKAQPVSAEEIARRLAWRQGGIALDGQPLAEAVAEFNRYNTRQIIVADPSIARYRLGGYFETRDVAGFVKALQTTFPIAARTAADGSIRLERAG